ncbi:Uu.00g076740.m01.CDS01 [Anthostomella pinea]|uniref:Uu.00g076740.m01.CDS01 n=1 Tax=Anthostomella pinea TaxID=933095 RepID=A0AAI8YP53_9PEZI|nr:Uu.00g076740.m01.CDS01 [Anthostomella pinea]
MARPARAFKVCLPHPHSTWNARPRGFGDFSIKSGAYGYSTSAPSPATGAVVAGAGPGGITVLGNLLEQSPHLSARKFLWVDPHFEAGRVNSRYREVPSNTNVKLFLQFANEVSAFRDIVDATPKPNAVTALQALPQDKGCRLSYAADMCLMLTEGLAQHPDVKQRRSKIKAAVLDEQSNVWKVTLHNGEKVTTSHLVLCTGSSPISKTIPSLEKISSLSLKPVDLDYALKPTLLDQTLDHREPATVAVIGASHSAILVLMNLVNMASSSHPQLRVKWFTRNKLRYAEFMDGWILRDNTGLKGQAADWARQNLDEETFQSSLVSKIITKHWTTGNEDQVYRAELPDCTHIIQAVGYNRNPLPDLQIVERDTTITKPLHVEFDHVTGRFFKSSDSRSKTDREYVPRLFGAGIAFPERVTDPHGNVEYAVGFWKFMRFAKKVVPEWMSKA